MSGTLGEVLAQHTPYYDSHCGDWSGCACGALRQHEFVDWESGTIQDWAEHVAEVVREWLASQG